MVIHTPSIMLASFRWCSWSSIMFTIFTNIHLSANRLLRCRIVWECVVHFIAMSDCVGVCVVHFTGSPRACLAGTRWPPVERNNRGSCRLFSCSSRNQWRSNGELLLAVRQTWRRRRTCSQLTCDQCVAGRQERSLPEVSCSLGQGSYVFATPPSSATRQVGFSCLSLLAVTWGQILNFLPFSPSPSRERESTRWYKWCREKKKMLNFFCYDFVSVNILLSFIISLYSLVRK